jgi:hypothetical protein
MVKRYRSRQEIFNNAWNGMVAQKWQQCVDDGCCVYRKTLKSGRILKCAIGWNIADSRYDSGLEGDTVMGNAYVAEVARISEEDRDFARILQNAHDDAINGRNMKMRFMDVAYEFKLTIPEKPSEKSKSTIR